MNRSYSNACLAAAMLVSLLLSPNPVRGQQPPPQPPPLDPEEAAELASRVAAQVMSLAETNGPGTSNDPAPLMEPILHGAPDQFSSNSASRERTSVPADSNRSGDRRSSSRRSGRDYSYSSRSSRGEDSRPSESSPASGSRASNTQAATNRPDFSTFRIIPDRNIFDPNRRPLRTSGPREKPKTIESFSLVGVMSYEKGDFAFFDGTSSAYRKALKQNDIIAGYRIAGINSSTVQLASGTNQLELQVGMGLRREDEGEWTRSGRSELLTGSSPSTGSSTAPTSATQTDAAATGSESDVLKRLRERREKE